MVGLTLDLWTCDVGADASSPEDYAHIIATHVQDSWNSGADIVVLPEYTWMGLERFVQGEKKLAGVSDLFWNRLWPDLQAELAEVGKLVVLGTTPWVDPATGAVYNRAPIIADGHVRHQDKLNLTPWETMLAGGDAVRLFTFAGLTFAVIICLDIEVPELSVLLRGRGVDCILVPSATESILGVERVSRCASARSVELGCYVGVSHLVGRTESELVDENMGRLAWFRPSQTPCLESDREVMSALFTEGWHAMRVHLDHDHLAAIRKNLSETNPAVLTPGAVRCELD